MCRSKPWGLPLPFLVAAALVALPLVLAGELGAWLLRVFFEPPNWPRDYSLGE